jgi:hypothetical protein
MNPYPVSGQPPNLIHQPRPETPKTPKTDKTETNGADR